MDTAQQMYDALNGLVAYMTERGYGPANRYIVAAREAMEAYQSKPKPGEKPVGTCPGCGEPVFNSLETDGPVWTCPRDLSPSNRFWKHSGVTEEQREKAGVYSNCYEDFGGYCGDHMPLHSACYDKGNW